MKKIIAVILILILIVGTLLYPVNAQNNNSETSIEDNTKMILINDEKSLREYFDEIGEEYDPSVIAVYQISKLETVENNATGYAWWHECEVRNKRVSEYVNRSLLLKQFGRPAGTVKISESVSVKTVLNANAKITIEMVSAGLNMSIEKSTTFRIDWSNTFSYPVVISIYPRYQRIAGELWDNDVWNDDFLGYFTIDIPKGDDIVVRRA